ncbi:HIT-like domain-containing protein [Aspergillus pseudotamarii]|uniref:HIT-like domain-containing protein n=1 Tax=Aspergillus pseudotamarii TaxID=132259 RepID=A0A5N6SH65_ASPPS|nr:HIT-like domain-containing protein [Aspergillus pseudotamarii]KAE8133011.1 HIT-like domain-containing protein [Aspergillus pseudotamarii]
MSTLSSCPFCNIASTYPPIPPTAFTPENTRPNLQDTNKSYTSPVPLPDSSDPAQPTAHLILSTKHVLAFLDIMPLTRGHVLVIPRTHYEKIGDVDVQVSRELGQWLPILSRVVMRTISGEDDRSDWNWNVVQNNGIRAAQQVPHAHFHIIPRPSSNPASNAARASFVMFGRGQREELDDDEGEELAGLLRGELAREVRRIREEGVDLECEVPSDDDDRSVKGKL